MSATLLPALIAIDWGTTNRRIHVLGANNVLLGSERDDRGMLAMEGQDYAAEVAAIRARYGDLPMLCAGMVGAARGWTAVPYLPCPADLPMLAAALHWVEPGRTAIVPGLSIAVSEKADVMRGEEVQLLGAVAAGLVPADALLCQPGTHAKWARMAKGAVAGFQTHMTGELFALLRQHSLLAGIIDALVVDGAAFRAGVADAAQGKLLGNLFGIRAAALLGLRAPDDAASYASGLLIGSDVREQALDAGSHVHLLADPALGALYAVAIEAMGAQAQIVDSEACFLAGIGALWRLA
jgi:2-dehydro-3-deoxygalactonokinase